MIKTANFSECGRYRYSLTRVWDMGGKIAMCIGLNPSTANADKNDPTINILIKTLANLGYGGLRMTNLYAYCASKPAKLLAQPDKLGENDYWLWKISNEVDDVIFCWGSWKFISHRVKQVEKMFPMAKCFSKNSDGSPVHPMGIMWQKLIINELMKWQ